MKMNIYIIMSHYLLGMTFVGLLGLDPSSEVFSQTNPTQLALL